MTSLSDRAVGAPHPPRAWRLLPSGARLDLLNPSPTAWTDDDLARLLSRTYRWGGESAWPLPLSVAQHSLAVLALRRAWSTEPLTAQEALAELLHDAEEAFLGFDLLSPLKPALGQAFKDVSDRLSQAIGVRYGLEPWQPAVHAIHKRADLVAAVAEAVHCVGWSRDDVRDVLGLSEPIPSVDPLAEVYGGTPWQPWSADTAFWRFFLELKALRGEVIDGVQPGDRTNGRVDDQASDQANSGEHRA